MSPEISDYRINVQMIILIESTLLIEFEFRKSEFCKNTNRTEKQQHREKLTRTNQ